MITNYEAEILTRAFEESCKPEIVENVNKYYSIIESKTNWKRLMNKHKDTIHKFNSSYTILIKTFTKHGKNIIRQYSYNIYHRQFILEKLIDYITLVKNFMIDLKYPLDYFFDDIASERIKDDTRVIQLSKIITIFKHRMKTLKTMEKIRYWENVC